MAKRLADMTEPEITRYMHHLAGMLEALMPSEDNERGRALFALLVFDQPGMLRYVSNAQREDALRAVSQAMTSFGGGWIACNDRLPDDDRHVLVCTPEPSEYAGVWLGSYEPWHGGWFAVSGDVIEPTHWMEMPAPPKEVSP